MDYNKLIRYCELKDQQAKIEDELDKLRKDIISMHQDSVDINLQDYTLKIVYHDKRTYNEQRLFDALPDPELWKNVSKADHAKISALLKANILTEQMLSGTYTVARVPYLYVHKQ